MSRRILNWIKSLVPLLVLLAVAYWVLAPMLEVVPAWLLFGLIFAVGVILISWKGTIRRTSRLHTALVLFGISLLSGSGTLLLYGVTLRARQDSTYLWWIVGAFLLFALLIPMSRLMPDPEPDE